MIRFSVPSPGQDATRGDINEYRVPAQAERLLGGCLCPGPSTQKTRNSFLRAGGPSARRFLHEYRVNDLSRHGCGVCGRLLPAQAAGQYFDGAFLCGRRAGRRTGGPAAASGGGNLLLCRHHPRHRNRDDLYEGDPGERRARCALCPDYREIPQNPGAASLPDYAGDHVPGHDYRFLDRGGSHRRFDHVPGSDPHGRPDARNRLHHCDGRHPRYDRPAGQHSGHDYRRRYRYPLCRV